MPLPCNRALRGAAVADIASTPMSGSALTRKDQGRVGACQASETSAMMPEHHVRYGSSVGAPAPAPRLHGQMVKPIPIFGRFPLSSNLSGCRPAAKGSGGFSNPRTGSGSNNSGFLLGAGLTPGVVSLALAACFTVSILSATPVHAQDESAPLSSERETSSTHAQWFKDARYGLFIHWGLYAQPAGVWKGKRYYGISEWLMKRAKIPVAEYAAIARDFDPKAFDGRAWVRFAKAAGFKYIVMTSKHHDGFAMFGSKASDFNVVDRTPFGRDPLKELATAAKAEGMPLGFYYSQYQDWHDPDAAGNDWDFKAEGRNFKRYQTGKAEPQIEELLKGYGDVAILWFDTPQDITREAAQAFYDKVKGLQPRTLVSNRIGHGLGDYDNYRDAEVPQKVVSGKPWEALFTLGDSWGYSSLDRNPKSPTELIRTLATVASRGGNMILNIGPDATGGLPAIMTEPMLEVGKWLSVNGDSIYGTGASPFGPLPWGTVTTRSGTLFLHVFNAPADRKLVLPDANVAIRSVRLGDHALKWTQRGGDIIINLPQTLPDARDTVIRVVHAGYKVATQWPAIIAAGYDTPLSPFLAAMSQGVAPSRERNSYYFGDWKYYESIKGLSTPADSAEWTVRVLTPGSYAVTLEYGADGDQVGREGVIEAGGQSIPFQILATGPAQLNQPPPFVRHRVGVLRFGQPGTYAIRLRPAVEGKGDLFRLKAFTLHGEL
jgi:alpha-L-fucosidase